MAHALETNKTVTGEDVAAVIEGVEGPILDGRGYHTDEFAEAAERYHAMVVAAHKGHAKVEAPMPALRPYELVGRRTAQRRPARPTTRCSSRRTTRSSRAPPWQDERHARRRRHQGRAVRRALRGR